MDFEILREPLEARLDVDTETVTRMQFDRKRRDVLQIGKKLTLEACDPFSVPAETEPPDPGVPRSDAARK